MLAFVLAIGMSFAFTNATGEDYYATGYIELDNQWYTVSVNCQTTNESCKVTLIGDPLEIEHDVFSTPDGEPLQGGNLNPMEITDPRKPANN